MSDVVSELQGINSKLDRLVQLGEERNALLQKQLEQSAALFTAVAKVDQQVSVNGYDLLGGQIIGTRHVVPRLTPAR